MKIVKFFNADYFKLRVTTADKNIDNSVIEQAILNAQNSKIRSVLGDDLYIKISSMIEDGSISTDTNYNTLLEDYIIEALLKWTNVELAELLRYKFRNNSILMETTPNSELVEFNEFKWKIQRLEIEANNYTDLLKKRLINHSNLYPEYVSLSEQPLNPEIQGNAYGGFYTGPKPMMSYESKCNRDR